MFKVHNRSDARSGCIAAGAMMCVALMSAAAEGAAADGAAAEVNPTYPVGIAAFESQVRADQPPLGLTVSLGVRSDLVRSTGLDPFSSKDGISQSALTVDYRLGRDEMSSPSLGLEWDHGETSARARGAEAGLIVDRLSLSLEGRLRLTRRLAAFARLAPGLMCHRASLYDPSAAPPPYGSTVGGSFQQTAWMPTGDLSAGLDLRLLEMRTQAVRVFALWVVGEGGYGYAAAHDLVLSPHNEASAGRTDEPLRFGQLAYHGIFVRVRLALSF